MRVNIIELLAELTDDLREIGEIVSKKAIEIKEENSKHKKENDDLILKRFVGRRMTILISEQLLIYLIFSASFR